MMDSSSMVERGAVNAEVVGSIPTYPANEHIEYFKRFAKCYLKWSHNNMDRIVADAVKRQERIKAEEDKAKEREKYKPFTDMFKATNEMAKQWAIEDEAAKQWPIGTKLKIKLPS